MARFRYAVLEKDKAKGTTVTSGTETIDLPERDILSELMVQCRSLGAYSDDMVVPMHVQVSKLELLVDGSTVVKSLTGTQVRALQWYNGGAFGLDDPNQSAHNENFRYTNFPLYLGRFAGDTKYGLDMSAYSNPQLKITWDVSTTSWDGLTFDAHTSPTFTYSAIAKMIDGRPAGFTNKYMQSREIDTWTNANSAEHATEIPRGFDLWGIMHRAAYYNIKPYDLLDHIKLDFDNGKWLPIDMDYGQFWQVYKSWFPKPCEAMRYCVFTHGDTFDTRLNWVTHFDANELGTTTEMTRITTGLRGMTTISVTDHDGAAWGTAIGAWVRAVGWGPHQTMYIPMKQLTDGDMEVIPTTDSSRIDLKCTTGSAAGTSGTQHVVAEYLKPNGS